MSDTKQRLLDGAMDTLRKQGIAGVSARNIAGQAGVNQALIFYHFGSVDDLLVAACTAATGERVAAYRERFATVGSLRELLEVGRALHEEERDLGNVAVLAQMLAGAQHDEKLARVTAETLGMWTAEIESVLRRVLAGSPFAEMADVPGLAARDLRLVRRAGALRGRRPSGRAARDGGAGAARRADGGRRGAGAGGPPGVTEQNQQGGRPAGLSARGRRAPAEWRRRVRGRASLDSVATALVIENDPTDDAAPARRVAHRGRPGAVTCCAPHAGRRAARRPRRATRRWWCSAASSSAYAEPPAVAGRAVVPGAGGAAAQGGPAPGADARRSASAPSCWPPAHGGTVERSAGRPGDRRRRWSARRDAADRDPLFAAVPMLPDVLQWHHDEITELPLGAMLLAASTRYPHQAFRLGDRGLGLQFHIECDTDDDRRLGGRRPALLAELGYDPTTLVARRRRPVMDDVAEVWQPFAARFAALALGDAARADAGRRCRASLPLLGPLRRADDPTERRRRAAGPVRLHRRRRRGAGAAGAARPGRAGAVGRGGAGAGRRRRPPSCSPRSAAPPTPTWRCASCTGIVEAARRDRGAGRPAVRAGSGSASRPPELRRPAASPCSGASSALGDHLVANPAHGGCCAQRRRPAPTPRSVRPARTGRPCRRCAAAYRLALLRIAAADLTGGARRRARRWPRCPRWPTRRCAAAYEIALAELRPAPPPRLAVDRDGQVRRRRAELRQRRGRHLRRRPSDEDLAAGATRSPPG